MVDPNQVSKVFEDGLCPCRGCTTARKRVMKDILEMTYNLETRDQIIETILKYKETNKL